MAAIAVVALVAKAEEDWEVVNQVLKLTVQCNYMAIFHTFRIIKEARQGVDCVSTYFGEPNTLEEV
ncbi:hypothetical protein PHISP_01200 [Aspergillus sp. HF37]|nr:hypothetical protein PHISP_01200 [Aspergillus sp. HF37]